MNDDPCLTRDLSYPDKYVYHYTKLETALEHILPSMTIRLGLLEKVNDPKESKPWSFQIHEGISQNETLKHLDLHLEASSLAKSKTLVLCCSADDPELNLGKGDYWFRRGFGHLRMWAQYADNSRGVCLVLDRELLHEAIRTEVGDEGLYHGRVAYRNRIGPIKGESDLAYPFILQYAEIEKKGFKAAVDEHVHRFYEYIFLLKGSDWRDETEYRWVFRGETNEPRFVDINGALRAVIIGMECPEVYLPSFERLCCDQGVSLCRMWWSTGIMVGPDECAEKEPPFEP